MNNNRMNYRHSVALFLTLWVTTTALSQAIEIVQVDNPPVWGEDIQVTEEIRIGTLDGEDEYLFGSISAVCVTADGSIWVADRQIPVIRKYDQTGQFVKNIGRSGNGPGEYNAIGGMKVLPGDRVAIYDPRNYRTSIFDSEGTFLSSHAVTIGAFGARLFYVDQSSNTYIRSIDVDRIDERTENGDPPLIYTKHSPDGEIVDRLPIPPKSNQHSFVLVTSEGYRAPFNDAMPNTLSADGDVIVGDNREYSLEIRSADGPVRKLIREYEPARVGDGERKQWSNSAAGFEQRSDRSYPEPPRTKPAFRDIWTDHDGRIWVDRYVSAVELSDNQLDALGGRSSFRWREVPTFDVIQPDGVFLGTVILPRNMYVYFAKGPYVWAEYTDKEGAAYVVRLRID